mmetsp:Transcript_39197/g.113264  ORF Transcript_39197/g.113264 Transcript_39197/m.113264 type:complete len:587 (-) Transcript_39197:387-2147(-)
MHQAHVVDLVELENRVLVRLPEAVQHALYHEHVGVEHFGDGAPLASHLLDGLTQENNDAGLHDAAALQVLCPVRRAQAKADVIVLHEPERLDDSLRRLDRAEDDDGHAEREEVPGLEPDEVRDVVPCIRGRRQAQQQDEWPFRGRQPKSLHALFERFQVALVEAAGRGAAARRRRNGGRLPPRQSHGRADARHIPGGLVRPKRRRVARGSRRHWAGSEICLPRGEARAPLWFRPGAARGREQRLREALLARRHRRTSPGVAAAAVAQRDLGAGHGAPSEAPGGTDRRDGGGSMLRLEGGDALPPEVIGSLVCLPRVHDAGNGQEAPGVDASDLDSVLGVPSVVLQKLVPTLTDEHVSPIAVVERHRQQGLLFLDDSEADCAVRDLRSCVPERRQQDGAIDLHSDDDDAVLLVQLCDGFPNREPVERGGGDEAAEALAHAVHVVPHPRVLGLLHLRKLFPRLARDNEVGKQRSPADDMAGHPHHAAANLAHGEATLGADSERHRRGLGLRLQEHEPQRCAWERRLQAQRPQDVLLIFLHGGQGPRAVACKKHQRGRVAAATLEVGLEERRAHQHRRVLLGVPRQQRL